jgi:hypothetical protein
MSPLPSAWPQACTTEIPMIIVRAAEVGRQNVEPQRPSPSTRGTGMKILYKPFGIVLGVLAGLLSQKLFNAVWGIFDKEEPPKPTTEEANWPKVIAAAAVQGVTFRVTRATVDRLGAQGFRYFTGIWPGEKHQQESEAAEAVR